MKKLFLIKIILLLTMQSYAKSLDLIPQQESIKTILELEKEGRLQEALLTSASAADLLANDLKVDQIAARVDSHLNEIRNEVVVSKHSDNRGLSLFFGLLPIFSYNRKWDTAKILTANPEAVAAFPAKVSSDFQKLQKNLTEYVKENELGLVYIKAFAAKTVELATRLNSNDRTKLTPLVHSIVQKAQLLTFWGAQSISHCITTNYTHRKNSENVSMLLSFRLGLTGHFKKINEQMAHTEKACTHSSAKTKVSEIELISAKIFIVDSILKQYNEKLGLMEIQESKAPYYPTWGLSDYNMQ